MAVLMQDLMDLDAFMNREYEHGYGRVQDRVFARLGVPVEDRGLYIRMMVTLDVALDEGNGAIKKLDLKLTSDNSGLVYTDKRLSLPMIVSEVDAANVQYWLRFPSMNPLPPEDQKCIYHLGKRGVDGLLEYLGLGIYANSEKFGLLEILRHWWEKLDLDDHGVTLWWVDGDRRAFVRTEMGEDGFPRATFFFQLGGGFWGSRPVSLEEAAGLGQRKGRKVEPDQIIIDDLGS